MACMFRFVQYLTALTVLCSLGLIITSAAVDFWWISNLGVAKTVIGLWRSCTNSLVTKYTCTPRDNILRFEENDGRNKDIVLVALCICALFLILAFAQMLGSICQRYPSKCLILSEAIFTFVAVLCGSAALVWLLIVIENQLFVERSWAFFTLYAGCGCSILALTFSIVLLCMRAPGAYHTTRKDDEIVMLSAR